jgi:hypothetical protein
LPRDRRLNATFHPGQINLGAVKIRSRRFEQNWLGSLRYNDVPDVDVVFPITLIGTRDVPNIGARKQNQGTQVTRTHLLPDTLQAILAQPVKVNPVLPVRPGLAVDAARIPFMGLANEGGIHILISLHAKLPDPHATLLAFKPHFPVREALRHAVGSAATS